MLNVDMNKCVSCRKSKKCKEKEKILKVLSPLQQDLNKTETKESPDISLIVACQR